MELPLLRKFWGKTNDILFLRIFVTHLVKTMQFFNKINDIAPRKSKKQKM
jgi:hypothetical protein